MSQHRSPFTHRRYPLTMVCASYRVARATVYAQRGSVETAAPTRAKRGPKTAAKRSIALKDKLKNCCDPKCTPVIEQRIKQMEKFRASF